MKKKIRRRKIFTYVLFILAIIDNIYIYVTYDTYNMLYILVVVFLASFAIESLTQLESEAQDTPDDLSEAK